MSDKIEHVLNEYGGFCNECEEPWPCEVTRLRLEVATLEELAVRNAAEIERLQDHVDAQTVRASVAEAGEERLRAVMGKHYPTIAGHVMRLQEAGEERAANEWLSVAQSFRDACQI